MRVVGSTAMKPVMFYFSDVGKSDSITTIDNTTDSCLQMSFPCHGSNRSGRQRIEYFQRVGENLLKCHKFWLKKSNTEHVSLGNSFSVKYRRQTISNMDFELPVLQKI